MSFPQNEPPPLPPQPQSQSSSLSFTQGLLLGQLSVVLLIGAFIKFFIFGEAPPPPSRGISRRATGRGRSYSLHGITSVDSTSTSQRDKPSTSNVLRPVPSSSTNTRSILRKTYYNTSPTNPSSKHGRHRLHHSSHQPESLDWFNVLIAQTISQYRQTAYILKDCPNSSMLESLAETLNNPEKKPSFIDTITITDISLGEEFPIFSNCRVIAVDDPNSDGGRLQALMDVDLSDDNLSIAIQTSLLMNYPKPFSAVLPVALAVSVVRFSGTLCISFVPAATPPSHTPSPSPDSNRHQEGQNSQHRNEADTNGTTDDNDDTKGTPKTNLAFSFLPDYRLDLSVRSLIGSRSRLQDLPKVAQLVEARVQAWFEERVVEPRVQVVGLPGIWPRMGRTGVRGHEDSEVGTRPTTANASGSDGVSVDRDQDVEMEGLRYRRGGSGAEGADEANRGGINDFRSEVRERVRGESFTMPGSMPDAVPAL